ncbi:MAG: CAP domain-containing protein [Anaerolineae bacterium]
MYKAVRYVLTVVSVMVLTAPAVAAPPSPQIGTAVVVESGEVMPCFTGCGGVFGVPSSNPAYEQTVVEMVNAARAASALPPLKRVTTLTDAARYHATDMGVDNYFGHDSQDRVNGALQFVCNFLQRALTYYNPTYSTLSENAAAGHSTPATVMADWMASDSHRANILRAASCEIGVGYYEGGGDYWRYWVQDFGCRTDVYPIVINREAATTDDYHVNLYIYGSGKWTEMRLRNNSEPWGDWRSFQSELAWELPKAPGEHTVWVEMRNATQSATSSDSIYSTWSPPPITLNVTPTTVAFVYDGVTGSLTPPTQVVNLTNSTSTDVINWSLTTQGNWFTATPANGTTPGTFTIAPTTFMTQTSARYTGAVTVTATAPPETVNAVQRVNVTLDVQVPALGGLPDAITFTYSIPSQQLIPSAWTLTPRNVGSFHLLNWNVTSDAPWAQIAPPSGTTPQSFSVTPTEFSTSTIFLYTGMLTVTVNSPTGVAGSPHQVRMALKVVDEPFNYIYLPLVCRNF